MTRETFFQWPYSLEYAVDSPPSINLLHGSPLSEWGMYEATVTPDALAAPGGDVSADLVLETTATSSHFLDKPVAVLPNTDYTLSVYLHAQDRTYACVHALGDTLTAWAYFDLSVGGWGAASGVDATRVSDEGDGWYRCSFTFNTGADTLVGVGVAPSVAGSSCWSDEYAGDAAKGIYAARPQLELGTTTTDAVPSYYVVPVTIAYTPGMRADFRDLRFRDEGMVPLAHRLESYTAGTTATFLLEIRPGQDRLSVLYGNGAAVSASDATFCPALDTFSGAAVDAAIWTDLGGATVSGGTLYVVGEAGGSRGVRSIDTFGVGTAVRLRLSVVSGAEGGVFVGSLSADGASYAVLGYAGAAKSVYTRDAGGSVTSTATPMGSGYHVIDVARCSADAVVVAVDGAVVATHTTNIPTAGLPIAVWLTNNTGMAAVDWVTVRPCLATEPALSYVGADLNPWCAMVNRPCALFDVPFDWTDFEAVRERALVSYTVRRSASDVMYSADVTIHGLIPQGTNFTRVKLVEPDHNGIDRLIFFGFLPAQTSTIQAAKNSTNYKGWDYGYFIAGRDPGMSYCTMPSATASPGAYLKAIFDAPGQWPDLADTSRNLFDTSHIDVDAPAAWNTAALPVRDIVVPTTSKLMALCQKIATDLGCIFYPRWIDIGTTPAIGHTDPAYQIVLKEAEDYDAGGEGVGYHDTTAANLGGAYRKDGVDIEYFASEAGFNVGWVRNGEWLSYTVNFPVADTYVARFRTASAAATGARSFKVYLDGALVDTISVDGTGSYSAFAWNTDTCDVVIGTAGTHTIKLLFDNAGDDSADRLHMNIASMTFTPTPAVSDTVPSTTVPAIYFCDEADLDDALGLPVIEIPPYDPTLAGAVRYVEDTVDMAGAVIVRYRQPSAPDVLLDTGDPWIFNGYSYNGLELPIDHVETVETPITTATANALRDALKTYYAGNWGTVTASFVRRPDLQLFQRLWFRGHAQVPEYEADGTTPVLFRIIDISYSVGLARCDVSITAVPARKFSIERQIARTRAPDPATEIEAIARDVVRQQPQPMTGTVNTPGATSMTVDLDRGGTITAVGVALAGDRVLCVHAEGVGYVATKIA